MFSRTYSVTNDMHPHSLHPHSSTYGSLSNLIKDHSSVLSVSAKVRLHMHGKVKGSGRSH